MVDAVYLVFAWGSFVGQAVCVRVVYCVHVNYFVDVDDFVEVDDDVEVTNFCFLVGVRCLPAVVVGGEDLRVRVVVVVGECLVRYWRVFVDVSVS